MVFVYIGLGLIGGWAIATLVSRLKAKSLSGIAQSKLDQAKEKIEREKRDFEIEKKEELHRLRVEFEKETREKREEHQERSRELKAREEASDRQSTEIERKQEEVAAEKQELEKAREEVKTLEAEQRQKLERIAGITASEAKENLLEVVKKEARAEADLIIRKAEQQARETARKKAQEIIVTAVQRYAVDEANEGAGLVVQLPDNEMKGRIIGKEGRNIRIFEALTGVDLVVDDTPESVLISCFDPLRRKIAEISLKRLIADTRIHPARIEEVVGKAKEDVDEIISQEGQKAASDMGVSDLHPELIKLLGKLNFRTSYGQNVLKHSREVAYIAGTMSAEIGLDSASAKRAGLLHDIGKAVDQEMEGSHALIGGKLAQRYGESPRIVHAIEAHHEEKSLETSLAILVQTADAVSAARPGARKEVLEAYLERVEKMEKVATSFSGVKSAYAVRSGRELWVMVEPEQISDEEARELSRDIARAIEKEMNYPGTIKIKVTRATSSVEYAK